MKDPKPKAKNSRKITSFEPDEAIARRKSGPGMSVGKLFSACLESKRSQGLRTRSIRDLAGTLSAFAKDRPDNPAGSITPTDVETWLAGLPVSARRRRGHLVNLQTGFAHGVRLDILERNPCSKAPRPVVEAKETAILTPEQTEKLFRVCEREDPELLGLLALAAFAGFRPESEVARMDRAGVEAGLRSGFLAPPTLNKTRRRRLVPVSPNLREWLQVWIDTGGELVPKNLRARLMAVRRAAGLDPWPQNVLRHSRVSYRLAQTGDEVMTAAEDGHSAQMLHQHYRALVTAADAERYFGILPTLGLDLHALARAERERQDAVSQAGLRRPNRVETTLSNSTGKT